MNKINLMEEFDKLRKESTKMELQGSTPQKDQEFYLFRGAQRCFELKSSIQVFLSKRFSNWVEIVRQKERCFIEKFINEVAYDQEWTSQYSWYCPPHPQTDTFWFLSAMQHFGCPTRMCDFTSNFWMAVFFAVDGANEGEDMCIYRLKCKNNDLTGNKLPKGNDGKPWENSEGYDMNEFVGYLIGYNEFKEKKSEIDSRLSQFRTVGGKSQFYGWDTPHVQNARIKKQNGFFVYNVDVDEPLETTLERDAKDDFDKFSISGTLLKPLKRKLEEMKLVDWKVYLDLDRCFEKWKAN